MIEKTFRLNYLGKPLMEICLFFAENASKTWTGFKV